jgi:hypothetical protein
MMLLDSGLQSKGYCWRAGKTSWYSKWKGETFADLLNFASGFNEFAHTASVNVLQNSQRVESSRYKVKRI